MFLEEGFVISRILLQRIMLLRVAFYLDRLSGNTHHDVICSNIPRDYGARTYHRVLTYCHTGKHG